MRPQAARRPYDRFVNLADPLVEHVGDDVLENVMLRGNWTAFENAVSRAFGHNSDLTNLFLVRLQEMGSPRNPNSDVINEISLLIGFMNLPGRRTRLWPAFSLFGREAR
jgi:hypothetical protein